MKPDFHYKIGQKIGLFTISSYEKEGLHILTCECGSTITGDSSHITGKISNMLKDGYVACQKCQNKLKKEFEETKLEKSNLASYRDAYNQVLNKAKKRGKEFALTFEECLDIFQQDCYYCSCPPSNTIKRRSSELTTNYQGIDRIDSSIGYYSNNVVPCCKYCNGAKLDRSVEEFNNHIENMYNTKVQRLAHLSVGASAPKWEVSSSR